MRSDNEQNLQQPKRSGHGSCIFVERGLNSCTHVQMYHLDKLLQLDYIDELNFVVRQFNPIARTSMVDRSSSAEDLLSLCLAKNVEMQHLGLRFMPDTIKKERADATSNSILYAILWTNTALETLTCCSRFDLGGRFDLCI